MDSNKLLFFKREIDILKMMKHKNVIELKDVFESYDSIFLVFDYMEGGDLKNYLQ